MRNGSVPMTPRGGNAGAFNADVGAGAGARPVSRGLLRSSSGRGAGSTGDEGGGAAADEGGGGGGEPAKLELDGDRVMVCARFADLLLGPDAAAAAADGDAASSAAEER